MKLIIMCTWYVTFQQNVSHQHTLCTKTVALGRKDRDTQVETTQLRNWFSWSELWPVNTCPWPKGEVKGLLCDCDEGQYWVHWVHLVDDYEFQDSLKFLSKGLGRGQGAIPAQVGLKYLSSAFHPSLEALILWPSWCSNVTLVGDYHSELGS